LGNDLADAVRAATRDAWPNGGPRRGRLFAFGFDAYRLAIALRDRGVMTNTNTNPNPNPNTNIEGLTGRLSLDPDRRIHRELIWAEFHNGEVRMLPASAQ